MRILQVTVYYSEKEGQIQNPQIYYVPSLIFSYTKLHTD
jgi:hypothetical protein